MLQQVDRGQPGPFEFPEERPGCRLGLEDAEVAENAGPGQEAGRIQADVEVGEQQLDPGR